MPQVLNTEEDDIIIEGKTKRIHRNRRNKCRVIVESKNDITKWNGAVSTSWEDKGAQANKTACNIFRYLNYVDVVPTHFIEETGERTFSADRVIMYPLEVVYRRIKTGSALYRYPGSEEGEVIDLCEIFYKNVDDPYALYNMDTGWYDLYDPKKPIYPENRRKEGVPANAFMPSWEELQTIIGYQRLVFEAVERAWADQNVVLVDLKCEYGKTLCSENLQERKIVLADVIDGDSCRIWPGGNKKQAKDKDIFRQMVGEITEADKQLLRGNYAWIKEATAKFLGNYVTA